MAALWQNHWGGGETKNRQEHTEATRTLTRAISVKGSSSIAKIETEKTVSTSAGHGNSSILRNHIVNIFHRLSAFGP